MSAPSVYVIGDSISIQYGPYLEAMLRGRADYSRKTGEEEALKDLDVPQGANGGDSSMVREFLAAQLAAPGFRPDLILVNCGLHDIKTNYETGTKQVPLEAYEANLRAIVADVRARGLSMAFIRTTPVIDDVHNSRSKDFGRYAADLSAYNARADAVMSEANVPLIDLHGFTTSLGNEEVFCDHVHFTDEVRKLQAAFLAGAIDALLGGQEA